MKQISWYETAKIALHVCTLTAIISIAAWLNIQIANSSNQVREALLQEIKKGEKQEARIDELSKKSPPKVVVQPKVIVVPPVAPVVIPVPSPEPTPTHKGGLLPGLFGP
jgi:hypothetical protein